MERKFISRLGDINKELLLILSIIAAAGVVNFFIAGQRLVLTFYNLPTLMAAITLAGAAPWKRLRPRSCLLYG